MEQLVSMAVMPSSSGGLGLVLLDNAIGIEALLKVAEAKRRLQQDYRIKKLRDEATAAVVVDSGDDAGEKKSAGAGSEGQPSPPKRAKTERPALSTSTAAEPKADVVLDTVKKPVKGGGSGVVCTKCYWYANTEKSVEHMHGCKKLYTPGTTVQWQIPRDPIVPPFNDDTSTSIAGTAKVLECSPDNYTCLLEIVQCASYKKLFMMARHYCVGDTDPLYCRNTQTLVTSSTAKETTCVSYAVGTVIVWPTAFIRHKVPHLETDAFRKYEKWFKAGNPGKVAEMDPKLSEE